MGQRDEFLFGLIRRLRMPVCLVLTKIDLVQKEHLLPLIDSLTRQFNFAEIIPVSARKRDGLNILIRKIVAALPEGERYYPKTSTPTSRSASWSPNLFAKPSSSKPARKFLRIGRGHRAVRRTGARRATAKEGPGSCPPAAHPHRRRIYCERDGQKRS